MRIAGLLSWAIFAAALLPAVAAAQRAPYAPTAAADVRPLAQAQRMERLFLQLTAENMRFQHEAAQLVLAKAGNLAVLEVASDMAARQRSVQPEVQRLLHARSMALPLPHGGHNKVLKQMAKLSGAKLERVFIEEVALRSGQADVANFEKMAEQAQDPALRAWIDRQLPVLRAHVARAGKALPAASARAAQRAV